MSLTEWMHVLLSAMWVVVFIASFHYGRLDMGLLAIAGAAGNMLLTNDDVGHSVRDAAAIITSVTLPIAAYYLIDGMRKSPRTTIPSRRHGSLRAWLRSTFTAPKTSRHP